MAKTLPVWLVTGSRGFLGGNAGAFLSGRAARIGASRLGEADPLFDESVASDLIDPGPLVDVITERRPDVVLHAAAVAHHGQCEADPDRARLVNVDASEVLARAAAEAGSRFVLISTDAVFDGARGHYSEEDQPNPTSAYGQTKLDAERVTMSAADALVVRTNFFGWSPSGQRSILEFFVNALTDGQPVRGFTDFTTTSAYAQVLLSTIWKLVQHDASGIVHVTSPDSMTKYDFGVAVAEEFDLDPALITPTRADIDPPRNGDISLDVSKVEDLLRIKLPSMKDGIRLARQDATTLRRTVTREPPL